jgi:hypothetical protein
MIIIFLLSNISFTYGLNIEKEEFKIKNFAIDFSKPIIHESEEFSNIELSDSNTYIFESGKPKIPYLNYILKFPKNTIINQVSLNDNNFEKIKLTNIIKPSDNPKPFTLINDQSVYIDKEIYSSSDLYPDVSFKYKTGMGLDENERVLYLMITCYPIRYSPLNNEIFFSNKMSFSVEYETSENIQMSDNIYDLLIITPSRFKSDLQPLIDHKNDNGVKTIAISIEDSTNTFKGRDLQEQVKYTIKDAIEEWGIKYVLIVGDKYDLPGRDTHIYYVDPYGYQNEWIFPSDLYFADIYEENMAFSSWDSNENDIFAEYNWNGNTDIIDLFPDVYLGRLACNNKNELNIVINKIIDYESDFSYQKEWYKNMVLIGGDSLPFDAEAVDEGEYVHQHVMDILTDFTPVKVWASNGLLYEAENINNAINDGCGLVFFNGHGNLDTWATHPHESNMWIPQGNYRNDHVDLLTNQEKLPVIISDACYHNSYHTKSDCFGWNFITNPNGGAIAFLGGTDVDLSYGGVDIITKGVEKLCLEFSNHYMNGSRTYGELWGKSLTTYMLTAIMDEMDIITMEESEPFGDPSLIIRPSNPPSTPNGPFGPDSGIINREYTYSTNTEEPDDEQIYFLFDWDDGTNSGWLGPFNSFETCIATHTWLEKGNYIIRVKAKDEYNSESDWAELEVSMPKSMFYLDRIFVKYPIIHQLLRFILKI